MERRDKLSSGEAELHAVHEHGQIRRSRAILVLGGRTLQRLGPSGYAYQNHKAYMTVLLANLMNISVEESLDTTDAKSIYELYESVWPNEDRTIADVSSIVEGSEITLGVYDMEGSDLIGFARILTDFTAKALICDIVIEENFRGNGLGGQLIETTRDHPRLDDVDTIELYCRDELVQLYQKYGFTDDIEMGLMRLER